MTSRELIVQVCEDLRQEIAVAKVKHRELTDKIEKSLDMEEVTAIAGVRRAGKTHIMYELIKKHGGTYINFEDERLADFSISDFDKLYLLAAGEKSEFLFLDEVQNITGWEKFAARIQKKTKLIVSGSNSSFLSSEFSSALTGRTMTYRAYPLSFSEFLSFTDSTAKSREELRMELENYLDLGGFPRIVQTKEKRLAQEYFDRIIYRDIIPRFRIKKPESLHRLAVYLLSTVGSRFSYRRLRQYCDLKHETSVKEYIHYLEQAFLLSTLNKFNPSVRSQEASPKKVYTVDVAFTLVAGSARPDKSRLLENAVLSELQRREEKEIFYAEKNGEIDFLLCNAMKPKTAINVSYEINEKKTLEREVKGLNGLKSGINRNLVTMYPPKFDLPKGIEYADAVDFFTGKFAL